MLQAVLQHMLFEAELRQLCGLQVPRRRFSSRQRTSRYMGVGSSNRKNQWQARILVHGKVTHLGYYETEEDAARVYDRVSISLHGDAAQTNFPAGEYQGQNSTEYSGLDREDLQRALGVKPMDKSSKSGSFPSCSSHLHPPPPPPAPVPFPYLPYFSHLHFWFAAPQVGTSVVSSVPWPCILLACIML